MATLAAIRQNETDPAPSPELVEKAREKLIVALDFSTISDAEAMVRKLGNQVNFYKVGLGLQLAGGDEFARRLKMMGKRVFLDYKYYDIEETVRNAVARAAEIHIDFLTVHGVSGILKGAVAGRGTSNLKILCVTVLTSMDAEDIAEMGVRSDVSVEDLVVHRALKALSLGVDGVIASAKEVESIKNKTANKLMVVTPGIRREGHPVHDQKRVASPYEAVKAGADYLVVGRDITNETNPNQAAHEIIVEMARALVP